MSADSGDTNNAGMSFLTFKVYCPSGIRDQATLRQGLPSRCLQPPSCIQHSQTRTHTEYHTCAIRAHRSCAQATKGAPYSSRARMRHALCELAVSRDSQVVLLIYTQESMSHPRLQPFLVWAYVDVVYWVRDLLCYAVRMHPRQSPARAVYSSIIQRGIAER